VRFASHGQQHWRGYQVHWTESCDAELPHLITHVATTPSHVTHDQVLPRIHADLQRLDLLPSEHLVDGGYTSADNVVASAQDYGVRLVGPLAADSSWQAHTEDGITLNQFQIDRAKQQATCPQGQTSVGWREGRGRKGVPEVYITFPQAACQACELRARCTKAADGVRRLKLSQHHEVTQAGRQQQQTAAFRAEYAQRAGIEGTVSAMVRQHGARRTRYIGQAKTEVQHLLSAMAANVRRAALWLMGERPGTTRPPGLSCLAPAQ
jgi:transposase